MIEPGPIIFKEFVQATHQRRTYVLRTVLPGVAVLLVAPQLLAVLGSRGQDWRTIAGICRPVFTICAWIQLVAFPLLGVLYAMGSLRDEWSRRTMEILCATTVSRATIVYGKFACAVGKVLLIGLTLLPVMGIWIRLGRIPAELALGSLGIVGAGTLLFAALAFVQAALYRPGKKRVGLSLHLLLAYLMIPIILGAGVWKSHPWLVAAVPHWSFYYVMEAKAPGGLTFEAFTPLAIGVPLGVALLALVLTPLVFNYSFHRYLGTPGWRGLGAALVPRWFRRRIGSRPPLRPTGDPFVWQEKGAQSQGLRWILWITYAITGLVALVIAYLNNDYEAFHDPASWLILAGIGAVVLCVLSTVHGAGIFAREKMRDTAEALILTGNTALAIYKAKLRSIVWSLRYSFAGLAVPVIAYVAVGGKVTFLAAITLCLGLVAPVMAGVIGLVFGAAARSTGHALAGMLLSLGWAVPIIICFPMGFTGAIVGTVLMLVLVKVWTVWRLSFLMTFVQALLGGVMVGGFVFMAGLFEDTIDGAEALVVLALTAFAALSAVIWFFIGVYSFEGSMLNETARRAHGVAG